MTLETTKKKTSLIRRLLKYAGIALITMLIIIIATPFFFKEQIIQIVKDKINENINAKVNYGKFEFTLFSSFPDFSLSLDSLIILNVGDFEGDTLLYAENLSLGLNLMSVIKGKEYKINTISINKPRIHAKVLNNGKANWDITKPSNESANIPAPPPSESSTFKMTLKKFEIINGYIVYDDASMNIKTKIVNLNHSLYGDFTSDVFLMETNTDIEKFTLNYGGITYLNNVKTVIKADLDANMQNFKFTFKNNEFSLNELTIGLDGFFAMPKEDIDVDLKFKTNQTEFKHILSLIPSVYTDDFSSVKTAGLLSLNGFVKGIYNEVKMPSFGLKLNIKDAMFQYPSLPKSATNIQIDLVINNKTGNPDATVIDLNNFHLEMAGNPVDAKMHLSSPISDANIKAEVIAKINLATIKDVIPLEKGDDLNGMITADIKVNGLMSSIEKKQYDKFDAKGNFNVLNMSYKSKSINYPTQINNLNLNFTPKFVELSQFKAKIGRSDIQMDGKIENFLQYALQDSMLQGSFNFNSSLLDLNELMAHDLTEGESAGVAADTAPLSVIEIPANLNLMLNAKIDKFVFDNLSITAITGGVKINDSKLILDNIKMDFNELGGNMGLSGVYNSQNLNSPSVNFDLSMSNFDIAKTFKTFNSVQKLAPIGKYAKGKFGTSLKFTSLLNKNLEPDFNTLTGGGKLTATNVSVEGFEPINKLADVLNQPKYKKIEFENINASYKFKDGRVEIEEMPIKMGAINANVKGSTGFDQSIDYTWVLEIPSSEFGAQANAAAGALVNLFNNKVGTNVKLSDKVKVKVLFGGTVTKPTIKTDLLNMNNREDSKELIKEQVKEQVKEIVNQGVDMAKEKARAEAEKLKAEARAQANKIMADAKVLADKTKNEGYAAIDKTVNEAKNIVAKGIAKQAAPSAKKEVDKKVAKILEEANNKANSVLKNAGAE